MGLKQLKPLPFCRLLLSVCAIDFTPDGSRVYTLDTGNGIIAFGLAPKLAAPSICGQPSNFVGPIGNIGFFGVDTTGAPLNYQWRFHGTSALNAPTNINNATNTDLDIYYIQSSGLGFYSVAVTNSLGAATSSVVYLDTPMLFTTQISDSIVPVGGTFTLFDRFNGVQKVGNALQGFGFQQTLTCLGPSRTGQCLGTSGVDPSTGFRVV